MLPSEHWSRAWVVEEELKRENYKSHNSINYSHSLLLSKSSISNLNLFRESSGEHSGDRVATLRHSKHLDNLKKEKVNTETGCHVHSTKL